MNADKKIEFLAKYVMNWVKSPVSPLGHPPELWRWEASVPGKHTGTRQTWTPVTDLNDAWDVMTALLSSATIHAGATCKFMLIMGNLALWKLSKAEAAAAICDAAIQVMGGKA